MWIQFGSKCGYDLNNDLSAQPLNINQLYYEIENYALSGITTLDPSFPSRIYALTNIVVSRPAKEQGPQVAIKRVVHHGRGKKALFTPITTLYTLF